MAPAPSSLRPLRPWILRQLTSGKRSWQSKSICFERRENCGRRSSNTSVVPGCRPLLPPLAQQVHGPGSQRAWRAALAVRSRQGGRDGARAR